MKRKTGIWGILILLMLFLGGNAESVQAQTTGDMAYAYWSSITTAYGNRTAGSAQEWAMGDFLIQELTAAGYAVNIQTFTYEGMESRNIQCLKAGESEKEILIGAHYDSVATQGADDNASGTALLLAMAKVLATAEPPCSIRIVFFGAEEPGMVGSKAYVEGIGEEGLSRLIGMINIDSIAAGDNCFLHGGVVEADGTISGLWLYQYAMSRAQDLGLAVTTHPDVAGIPSPTRSTNSDQQYFAAAGIPYLYLEAGHYIDREDIRYPFTYQTADERVENGKIMHTVGDTLENIKALFPGRAAAHFALYGQLLEYIAKNLTPVETGAENGETTESVSLAAETTQIAETAQTDAAAETTAQESTLQETTVWESTLQEVTVQELTTQETIEETTQEAVPLESLPVETEAPLNGGFYLVMGLVIAGSIGILAVLWISYNKKNK